MSTATITIRCPEMAVNNTGWRPTSDRRAVELPCTGEIVLPDGHVCPLREFRFESCLVKFVRPGRWMVDPVLAWGYVEGGGLIKLYYPEEPVIRRGTLMVAQPIDNILHQSYAVLPDGRTAMVYAPLPEAIGRPQGIFGLGLRQFVVDAVTIKGTLTF